MVLVRWQESANVPCLVAGRHLKQKQQIGCRAAPPTT
jgi:hypothetical protein